jgi:hypothetical protein
MLLEVDLTKFCKTFWRNKCILKLKSCVNFCPQSLAPDFKAYTCVINNPYLSIGIYLVMQIRIALIPLITYTPPNDLATHNNVYNDRIFDKNIFIFYGKMYHNCSNSNFYSYDLIRSS